MDSQEDPPVRLLEDKKGDVDVSSKESSLLLLLLLDAASLLLLLLPNVRCRGDVDDV